MDRRGPAQTGADRLFSVPPVFTIRKAFFIRHFFGGPRLKKLFWFQFFFFFEFIRAKELLQFLQILMKFSFVCFIWSVLCEPLLQISEDKNININDVRIMIRDCARDGDEVIYAGKSYYRLLAISSKKAKNKNYYRYQSWMQTLSH